MLLLLKFKYHGVVAFVLAMAAFAATRAKKDASGTYMVPCQVSMNHLTLNEGFRWPLVPVSTRLIVEVGASNLLETFQYVTLQLRRVDSSSLLRKMPINPLFHALE